MSESGKIIVGMGGWSLPSFDLHFYPPEAQTARSFRKLEFYSRFFDMVEVNATFYSTELNAKNAQQWLEDASGNKNFVFAVKLFQGFTHSRDATKNEESAVHSMLGPLNENQKLAGLVLQFPSSVHLTKENRDHLANLAGLFKKYFLFVDVRHQSWNSSDGRRFLEDHRLHLINVDLPQIGGHIPLTSAASDGIAYFRLMGRNAGQWFKGDKGGRYRYLYSPEELQGLVDHMRGTLSGDSKAFAVFHNDPQANSLYNGFQVRHLIDPNKRPKAPETLVKTFPQLKEITEPVSSQKPLKIRKQKSLFD